MCGIVGAIWDQDKDAVTPETLSAMTESLTHRGPDDCGQLHAPPWGTGYARRPGVALGHRRLAVLDPASGQQPMRIDEAGLALVFNGEIYNWRELRRRLEGAGRAFRTNCDSEVLLHLYAELGPAFVEHLRGMFALAIWDAPRRRLLLARDRLGQKPLFYADTGRRLTFASELKALLAAGLERDLDPTAIDHYLVYQYVPHPRTMFRGVRQLPPAHRAIYENGRLTIQRYWRLPADEPRETPLAEAEAEVRDLLTESVRLRLQSDVPLGVFLSGGIDSSIIAALAQREMLREGRPPLKTFSIGFPEVPYDESPAAETTASALGTDHNTFYLQSDILKIIQPLAWHFDQPLGDSSAVPTYCLARLARESITVALSGDGGDELFAGYDRYRAVNWAAWVDRLGWLGRILAGNHLWQWLPGGSHRGIVRRWQRFSAALALAPPARYTRWVSHFTEEDRAALYRDDFLEALPATDPTEFLRAAWQAAASQHDVTAAAAADMATYLPCDLLAKMDIATMAHGLECRQPFLDSRLVEWAARLPLGHKLGWRQGKLLLRSAFADDLPAAVWTRPKMGFGVPLEPWLREPSRPLAEELLLGAEHLPQWFDPPTIATLLQQHTSGQDHGQKLWMLMMLEQWAREWLN